MTTPLPPPAIWLYIAIACAVGSVLLLVWARHMERAKRRKKVRPPLSVQLREVCNVCLRRAPLIDGECPDCRR